jgi:hypothetical protein
MECTGITHTTAACGELGYLRVGHVFKRGAPFQFYSLVRGGTNFSGNIWAASERHNLSSITLGFADDKQLEGGLSWGAKRGETGLLGPISELNLPRQKVGPPPPIRISCP